MRRPLFAACLIILLLTAGYGKLRPPRYQSYGDAVSEEVYLTGRVYAKEFKKGFEGPVLYLYIEPTALYKNNQEQISIYGNFICMLKNVNEEPDMGSLVTVRGKLAEFEPAVNPGQFDARLYYATLHICAKIQNGELLSKEGANTLKEGLWQLRCRLAEILEIAFTEEDSAVLKMMLLGDKTDFDAETKKLYREAGILHIAAISGLHISILGMGLYKLLRRLYLPNLPASVLTGGVMLLYGMMTGMPVSAVRAISMFLIRLLAGCIGRTYDMQTALMVCGVWMVLENPLYLYHAGFLLSYTAVLGVGVLKPAIEPEAKDKLPFADSLFTTLAISIFTLPVQLYCYYEVSVYGALFNLLVLPLMGVLLSSGVAVLFFMLLSPAAAGVPALLAHTILNSYRRGCLFLQELPGSSWTPGQPELWQLACFIILVGLVILLKKLSLRYKLGLLCGAVLIFGIRTRDGLTVTFIDVGQGDCICIELPDGSNYLVDGGSQDVNSVGTYRIEPFLKSQGISTLDAVFLSHADSDHINGVAELLAEDGIKISLLVLPCTEKANGDKSSKEKSTEGRGELTKTAGGFEEIASIAGAKGIPILWLSAGMEWEKAGVSCRCLHPAADFRTEDTNASSEVLYLSYENFSMLLAGDVERAGEKELIRSIQQADIGQVTLLKVAHHGSRNSTGIEFLQEIKPRYAIISAGRNNRYGHPHAELLERLSECGTRMYQTKEGGAIKVWTDGSRIKIKARE